MRVYIFSDRGALPAGISIDRDVVPALERVADDTDTSALVLVVYLLRSRGTWEAHTDTSWRTPAEFTRLRGEWKFVERFGTPEDLPERFRLIRIALGAGAKYPRTLTDIYGWELTYGNLVDHLAMTFAHELHHYQQAHLGMHPGKGEQAACRFSLERARECGFDVKGVRLPARRRKRRRPVVTLPKESRPHLLGRIKQLSSKLSVDDLRKLYLWARDRLAEANRIKRGERANRRFEKLRQLPPGSPVLILREDSPLGYVGHVATKVRTPRSFATRMLIRTADGIEWHWPMAWLKPVDDHAAE